MGSPARPDRVQSLATYLRSFVKGRLSTLLYRAPQSSLKPERLYAYLDAVWQTRNVPGVVLEIGCYVGGTAALASTLLRNTGHVKHYVCIDTFDGFVEDHFERDVSRGLPARWRRDFSANSMDMVTTLMQHYGCENVELVQGDIAQLDPASVPKQISTCLVDVDLEVPTYEALRRVYPRMQEGGIILVDDCETGEVWPGPRIAYSRFVDEQGLAADYVMGMGRIRR